MNEDIIGMRPAVFLISLAIAVLAGCKSPRPQYAPIVSAPLPKSERSITGQSQMAVASRDQQVAASQHLATRASAPPLPNTANYLDTPNASFTAIGITSPDRSETNQKFAANRTTDELDEPRFSLTDFADVSSPAPKKVASFASVSNPISDKLKPTEKHLFPANETTNGGLAIASKRPTPKPVAKTSLLDVKPIEAAPVIQRFADFVDDSSGDNKQGNVVPLRDVAVGLTELNLVTALEDLPELKPSEDAGIVRQLPNVDDPANGDDQLNSEAEFESSLEPITDLFQDTQSFENGVYDPLSASVPAHIDISLNLAIRQALQNSSVLSDVGGRLLQSPSSVATIHGPGLQATDPRFGVEGALSEFDAQFRGRAFFEKNDQVLNNEILGGGVNQFRQDLWRFQAELSKKAATGTRFAVRHNVNDDLNNATRNLFPRSFDWNTEAEIRHPLLQGAGVAFNRISGRSETPGVANGVMIAQVNSKMSIVDFQLALRDYVSNVENAYWDLVLAYRTLSAKKAARDRTLGTWQFLENLSTEGVVNQDKVDQAAEQYFRFKEDVENAYYGRPSDGTRSFNGSAGGSLQSDVGVKVAERRLRLIMGMPMDSDQMMRPVTEPPVANVVYGLHEATDKAMENRGELELQQMRVAKGNLQLQSDQNYLLPKLDMVARYRLRGLGDNLYDAHVPDTEGGANSILSNRHEWMIGAEVSYPLGFRQGHTAVRNAQLQIARERAIMTKMQRHLMHDVGNAISNKDRSFHVMRAALNRWEAANRRYEYLTNEDVQAAKKMDFTLILDADRKLAEAEVAYHRACVDYALSLKNLNLEMGTLFGYCDIHLASNSL